MRGKIKEKKKTKERNNEKKNKKVRTKRETKKKENSGFFKKMQIEPKKKEVKIQKTEIETNVMYSVSFKYACHLKKNLLPIEFACVKIDYETGEIISTFHEFIDVGKQSEDILPTMSFDSQSNI
jgi:hypothetical protein